MPEKIAEGTLEVHEKGWGFLRSAKRNYAIHVTDPLVPAEMIRRFGLRGGETVTGPTRQGGVRQGVQASFMPKPLGEVPGSGMHTHISLFEGEKNAFADPTGPYGLSKTGRQFMAGLLRHAREITAVTNQHVNSYKRFAEGSFAPTAVTWGKDNRTCSFRVVGHGEGLRVENRLPGADVNPYLAISGMIAGGYCGGHTALFIN